MSELWRWIVVDDDPRFLIVNVRGDLGTVVARVDSLERARRVVLSLAEDSGPS